MRIPPSPAFVPPDKKSLSGDRTMAFTPALKKLMRLYSEGKNDNNREFRIALWAALLSPKLTKDLREWLDAVLVEVQNGRDEDECIHEEAGTDHATTEGSGSS